jgi:hypothetical protein
LLEIPVSRRYRYLGFEAEFSSEQSIKPDNPLNAVYFLVLVHKKSSILYWMEKYTRPPVYARIFLDTALLILAAQQRKSLSRFRKKCKYRQPGQG